MYALHRHRDILFAGTTQGLFRLEGGTEALPRFTPLPEIKRPDLGLLGRGHRPPGGQ